MTGTQTSSPFRGTPKPPLSAPPPLVFGGHSLFLDFDGTLVEFAPRPDAVEVEPALLALLAVLNEKLEERLAFLSGRPLADLNRFLGPVARHAGGLHGAERQGLAQGQASPVVGPDARAALDHLRARLSAEAGALLVEDKGLAIALHFRHDPGLRPRAEALAAGALAAARGALVLQPGHSVIEVRPAGTDKGEALRAFMAASPFAGTRPVFLGDDLTDEPALAAAAELGGFGILVGAPRPTAACFLLPDVAGARAWLAAGAERSRP
ncbi:trehalose-phosphatase [Pararhodospirillum oryzae]|uniref:Trehalose 6-phosphate phosphatase n=1 Tax=Pararhodospirillum oryzae TaxID=478448 RepID=A0A512H4C3_9PROT|nr:trehalose-phosphatase [Pararhodospirillum oryzae]GEO80268.1 trehalose 6-phosphate phosphatase [Pararhodospirillum oryzae]